MAMGFRSGHHDPSWCVLLLDADAERAEAIPLRSTGIVWNGWVALSPDASQLAFAATAKSRSTYRVFVSGANGGQAREVVSPAMGPSSFYPVWMEDGESLVFIGPTDASGRDTSIQIVGGVLDPLSLRGTNQVHASPQVG